MDYRSFDPGPFAFPRARVDVLPKPRWSSFTRTSHPAAHALLASPRAQWYTRGRYALREGYRLSGVGPNAGLLAPAFHCRTMLDPAIALGAGVTLFPVRADLEPDVDAMAEALRRCRVRPAAALVTHYFGIVRDLGEVRAWCDTEGIALIEDCSHALFLPEVPGKLGRFGHYSVASPYKFFPMREGGVLWANEPAPPPQSPVRPRTGLARAAAWARLLATLVHPPTTPDVPPDVSDQACLDLPQWDPSADPVQHDDRPSVLYDRAEEGLAPMSVDSWVLRHTRLSSLIERRRTLYQRWVSAVAGMPNCRALNPYLPDDSVPYMFPLVLSRPASDFIRLKRLGMPVWRWDDIACSDCAVSGAYRIALLHLPCHQEISDAQFDWMAASLHRVVSAPSPVVGKT